MGSSTDHNDTPNKNNKAATEQPAQTSTTSSGMAQFDETKAKAKRLWAGLTDADVQSTGSVDQLADVIMQRFGGQKEVILQKLGGAPTPTAAK